MAKFSASVALYDPKQSLYASILTDDTPIGCLYQTHGVLEWLYPQRPKRSLPNKWQHLATFLLSVAERSVHLFGHYPTLNLHIAEKALRGFAEEFGEWASLLCMCPIVSMPLPPCLRGWISLPLKCPPSCIAASPVLGPNVFTDATKDHRAAVYIPARKILKVFTTDYSSAQKNELLAIMRALEILPNESFNLITDSLYCANALTSLPCALVNPRTSPIASLLHSVQALLLSRSLPIYVLQVRSHVSTSGPIFSGNDTVDKALLYPLEAEATQAHEKYHLSARSLRHLIGLTREEHRQIVKHCVACVPFRPRPHDIAVNPRGDFPNALWQMDVTHYQRSLIHVNVDTFSGFIMASVQPRETTRAAIAHLYGCFASFGVPLAIKTDNGPAYTSTAFKEFCAEFSITHITGIPYNPTGQVIVERANRTIKTLLEKQKGGVGGGGRLTQARQARLAQAIYILTIFCNFLMKGLHLQCASLHP